MLDRIYTKKTRRGNILKIVREHYLRDDLSCGSKACSHASCMLEPKQINFLQQCPPSPSAVFKFPHYIVPDTNIILHQV